MLVFGNPQFNEPFDQRDIGGDRRGGGHSRPAVVSGSRARRISAIGNRCVGDIRSCIGIGGRFVVSASAIERIFTRRR
jgi:hypothetical protein